MKSKQISPYIGNMAMQQRWHNKWSIWGGTGDEVRLGLDWAEF